MTGEGTTPAGVVTAAARTETLFMGSPFGFSAGTSSSAYRCIVSRALAAAAPRLLHSRVGDEPLLGVTLAVPGWV